MPSIFAISSTCSALAPLKITWLILHIALVLLKWRIIVDPFYVIFVRIFEDSFRPTLLFLESGSTVTVPVSGRCRCGSRLQGCYGYLPSIPGLFKTRRHNLLRHAPVHKLIFCWWVKLSLSGSFGSLYKTSLALYSVSIIRMVVLQEKGHALKKSLAELAIAANQLALKKRTQEVDDGR